MNFQKLFEQADSDEMAFAAILQRMANTPLKKNRLKLFNSFVEYMADKQEALEDEMKDIKIYGTSCENV